MKKPTTKSQARAAKAAPKAQTFQSVFDALADTRQEAANMRTRADLARRVTSIIKSKDWTQAVAAAHCGVTQPRINDLLSGHISRFSLDALVNIASTLGKVRLEVEEPETV